jgi:hypothetical protein
MKAIIHTKGFGLIGKLTHIRSLLSTINTMYPNLTVQEFISKQPTGVMER